MNKFILSSQIGFRWCVLIIINIVLAVWSSPGAGYTPNIEINNAARWAVPVYSNSDSAMTGDVGDHPSTIIGIDDLPVISYYDFANRALKVAHCGNATCSRDITFTTIDSTGFVGEYTSIALGADGLPVISYLDSYNSDLKVAHCGNTDCTDNNTITAVDTEGDIVGEISLTIGADSLPIISYFDSSLGKLKAVHCGNVTCSASNTTSALADNTNVYGYTSIYIGADNLPIISYSQLYEPYVRIIHCGDTTCTSGNTTSILGKTLDGGSSIAIGADNLPVISYNDDSGNLNVTQCGDVACSSGNKTSILDPSYGPTSIAIGTDGLPIISYFGVRRYLKAVHCGNAACTDGNATTLLDKTLGLDVSMTIGKDGLPVISYDVGVLKAAHCGNITCSSGVTKTVLDSGGMMMQWGFLPLVAKAPSNNTFITLDNTSSTYDKSPIAIGTDGLPVISYYDSYNNNIKVAHCGTTNCSSGNTFAIVAGNSRMPSIAIGTDGLPIISYYDANTEDLKVFYCGDPTCSSDNTIFTVDSTGNVGVDPSILLGSDGLPVIIYNYLLPIGDCEYPYLRVAHCGNATCSNENQITQLGSSIISSMAIGGDGMPVIGYFEDDDNEDVSYGLKVTHCENIGCSNYNTITLLENVGVPFGGEIAIGADGLPILSYVYTAESVLKLIHCGNAACTSGNTTSTIDTVQSGYSSIAIGADGLPIISYLGSSGDIKTVHCGDAACTSGNTISSLDVNGGKRSFITTGADGLPILSYIHDTDYEYYYDLIIAHCGDILCSSYLPVP